MTVDRLLAIVGLIGLPSIFVYARELLFMRRPVRRLLRLDTRRRLDVIAATSFTAPPSPGVADAHSTSIGELRGIASATRVLSRHYRGKPLSFYVSEESPADLTGDVLLLGSPLKNRWSGRFLDWFNRRFPDAGLGIDSATRSIALGGRAVEAFDQHAVDGLPREDLGVIAMASTTYGARRVILCAGLSTYGTEAAARFLFDRLCQGGDRPLGRMFRREAAAAVVHCYVQDRGLWELSLYDGMTWTSASGPRAQDAPAAGPAPGDRVVGNDQGEE